MARSGRKLALRFLGLILILVLFAACGDVQEKVDVSPQETVTSDTVVIEADGRRVTIEDASGNTLTQLFRKAQIPVREGDMVTLEPEQTVSGQMNVNILRRCTVHFVMEGTGENYTVVLYGGTVEDAMDAAGIHLSRAQTMDAAPEDSLADGMTVHIIGGEGKSLSSVPTDDPEETAVIPPSPGAAETPEVVPTPTPSEEVTVVSMERYEDCDGSGHGVIVYTYSDGSQVEVEY